MIRFGLRLAAAGGREAAIRLVVIATAVALGTGLLLATLAGMNATQSQAQRYTWLNTGLSETTTGGAADPTWWLLREEYFHSEQIGRLDVAGTGTDSPVPPGIPALPGAGEFYASPALHDLLRTTPADQLGDRFPGREIGTIGADALPSPDTLLAVVGQPLDTLRARPGATAVTSVLTAEDGACSRCVIGLNATMLTVSLSVVAAALLFPVLIFMGTATRLAAARREQRFAAMRLIGATPRQVSVLAAVESTVAALAGTVLGFGVFYALRPGLVAIPFTGATFFPDDLSLTLVDAVAVLVGIPLASALAARLALRRARISPLGVARRVTPKPPRAWRLIPLLVGIGTLAYFVGRKPATVDGQTLAYIAGFVITLVGLVLAGPWLTMLASRLVAARAKRPAALIAGRRLADDPMVAFRSVSGLVVALFVTTAATGAITSYVMQEGAPGGGSVVAETLSQTFWPEEVAEGEATPSVAQVPAGLAAIPGVEDVILVHSNLDAARDPANPQGPGLVACADLARHPEYGSCPPGVAVAAVWDDLIGPREPAEEMAARVWPASTVTDVAERPLLSVVVKTDGSAAARERARTLLVQAFPWYRAPATQAEWAANSARTLVQFQQLANVVILASLPIAGSSLAVGVIGGLNDRKRPFSVLRLTGVRLRTLRAVVLLESAVPLLIVAAVAIGVGFLAAALFLRAQLDYGLAPPGVAYYAIVGGGLIASLAIIASTLPVLRRITAPETARNE